MHHFANICFHFFLFFSESILSKLYFCWVNSLFHMIKILSFICYRIPPQYTYTNNDCSSSYNLNIVKPRDTYMHKVTMFPSCGFDGVYGVYMYIMWCPFWSTTDFHRLIIFSAASLRRHPVNILVAPPRLPDTSPRVVALPFDGEHQARKLQLPL